MFGVGGVELFLILLFGFLIFGPEKLPEMAKTLGKALAKFRSAQEEMKSTLNGQSFVDKESGEIKNPLEVIENAASDVQKKTAKAQKKVDAGVDKVVEKTAEKTESFAERKARYDRERAARKAEEAKAAGAAEGGEGAAGAAGTDAAASASVAAGAKTEGAKAAVAAAAKTKADVAAAAAAANKPAAVASTSPAEVSKKVAQEATDDVVETSAASVASEKQE